MYVEIHTLTKDGQDSLAGVLRLTDGAIVAEPDNRLLRGILAEPIYDPQDGRVWDAEDTPEEFLRCLRYHYKSAYLRASKAEENGKVKSWLQQQKNILDAVGKGLNPSDVGGGERV